MINDTESSLLSSAHCLGPSLCSHTRIARHRVARGPAALSAQVNSLCLGEWQIQDCHALRGGPAAITAHERSLLLHAQLSGFFV